MTKKIILGLIAGSAFVVLVAQYSLAASLGEEKVVYEYSQVENEQLQTVNERVKEEKELKRMAEIEKEKERLAKVEAERLAKKKAEEEEAARLVAEKEAVRIAEETRLAEEAEIARLAEEERLAAIKEEIAYQETQAPRLSKKKLLTQMLLKLKCMKHQIKWQPQPTQMASISMGIIMTLLHSLEVVLFHNGLHTSINGQVNQIITW